MVPELPDGPVVNNLPCTAEDAGSIPGRGTNIPYVTGQLSLCTTTRVHALQQTACMMQQRFSVLQLRSDTAKKKKKKSQYVWNWHKERERNH